MSEQRQPIPPYKSQLSQMTPKQGFDDTLPPQPGDTNTHAAMLDSVKEELLRRFLAGDNRNVPASQNPVADTATAYVGARDDAEMARSRSERAGPARNIRTPQR